MHSLTQSLFAPDARRHQAPRPSTPTPSSQPIARPFPRAAAFPLHTAPYCSDRGMNGDGNAVYQTAAYGGKPVLCPPARLVDQFRSEPWDWVITVLCLYTSPPPLRRRSGGELSARTSRAAAAAAAASFRAAQ